MAIEVWLLFFAGLSGLVLGAELLVRGASRLAAALGVPSLIVGLTVVAFGTSAPEAAVSVAAGFRGQPDIAIGNVVGSNIANILLILGLSALIMPLVISRQLIRLDVPLMIGISVLLYIFALGGTISRLEAAVLLLGIILYTTWLIRQVRRTPDDTVDLPRQPATPSRLSVPLQRTVQLAMIAGGLALLILGSSWLIDAAVEIARVWHVNELVIGLTVVAVGTSLPEVATSLVATIRGERDLAVGNIVGSNIFNILMILGLAGLLTPGGIPVSAPVLRFDLPVMLAVSFACLPVFVHGLSIARWEGALFLGYYVAYTAYLFLNASGHAALQPFSKIMLEFVIPITVITLLLLLLRAFYLHKER